MNLPRKFRHLTALWGGLCFLIMIASIFIPANHAGNVDRSIAGWVFLIVYLIAASALVGVFLAGVTLVLRRLGIWR